MRAAWVLLAAATLIGLQGCGDDSDDSSALAADPGPSPGPAPTPNPDPDPQPQPDPEPQPDPDPVPDPDPEPEPEPPPPPWTVQDTGTQLTFTAVSAINANTAWAAAGSDLFRTTDGGATWTFISQTPMDGLHIGHPAIYRMKFFDAQNGWAVVWDAILQTTDGGETWIKHEGTAEAQFRSMSWVGSTAWVTGNKSSYRKSVNGGQSWDGGDASFGEFGLPWVFCVGFGDEQTGWMLVAGANGSRLLKSGDGGSNWSLVAPIDSISDTPMIETLGPTHAWIASQGTILATADGSTWQVQSHPGSNLRCVDFVDFNVGWAVGEQILHTTDGGTTWSEQSTPQSGFRDVVFVSPTVGWVVGENGVILKTTTGGQ